MSYRRAHGGALDELGIAHVVEGPDDIDIALPNGVPRSLVLGAPTATVQSVSAASAAAAVARRGAAATVTAADTPVAIEVNRAMRDESRRVSPSAVGPPRGPRPRDVEMDSPRRACRRLPEVARRPILGRECLADRF